MKTHILCSTTFSSENHAVYEIMSKNMVETDRLQMTIRLRVACWKSKATRTQVKSQARAYTNNLLLFHSNICYVNAPQCYVIGTLPVLFDANIDLTD
jgi:hypothetical protein